MSPKDTLVVWHDDPTGEIVEKINKILARRGLIFLDDGKEHDGYLLFELKDLDRVPTKEFIR